MVSVYSESRPDKYDLCLCGRTKAKIAKCCRICHRVRLSNTRLPEPERRERRRLSVRQWYKRNAASIIAKQIIFNKSPEGRLLSRKVDRKRYDKTRGRDSRFKYALERKYKMTIEQFDRLFDDQNGRCAIIGCDVVFGNRRPWDASGPSKPCIDHDHATGHIRGLLCRRCNTAMGIVDRKDFLQSLMVYRDSRA